MRKIKFRAWDKRGKQMILTISQLHLESGMIVGHCGKDETWVLNDKNQYTLMQYTGLKDKNGKEIYEGDVIQSVSEYVKISTNEGTGRYSTENYEVRWELDKGRWGRFKNKRFEGLHGLDKDHLGKFYTIIGNIWENPELIS